MFKEIDNLISEIMDRINKLNQAYHIAKNAKHLINTDYIELLGANINSLENQYKALNAFRKRFKMTYGIKEEEM